MTNGQTELPRIVSRAEWLAAPAGWPQTPGNGGRWIRHHDRYGEPSTEACCHSTLGGDK